MSIAALIDRIEAGVSVRSTDDPTGIDRPAVLKTSALSGGRFNAMECKVIADDERERARVYPQVNCTLMSRMNTISLVGESVFVDRDHPSLFLPDRIWQIHPNVAAVDPYWLSLVLGSDRVRDSLRGAASGTSGSMKNISQVALRRIVVPTPPLEEQRRIAAYASMMVFNIAKTSALISAKKMMKRGLAQQLLTGRKRFHEYGQAATAGLPHDWRRVSLSDVTKELTDRNNSTIGIDRTMGVFKGTGLQRMRDHVRANDLRRYKVLPPDAFAYNPMRLNIGSIARSHLAHDCLVSPDYVVFRTETDWLAPAYLDQFRKSAHWSNYVKPAGSGSVRVRIYYRDLARLRIPLPPIREQLRIAEVLGELDHEIEILEALVIAQIAQKRVLVRTLLSEGIDVFERSQNGGVS